MVKNLLSIDQLIIIPSGPLHFVPFAALEHKGEFVIEKWRLCELSASSLLAVLKGGGKKGQIFESPLVAVANPTGDLKASEPEVSSIAGLFKKKSVYVGKAARMEATPPQTDCVHEADHRL